jgi:hypothetical protein
LDSLIHFDLAPPKTWEQFEELCADTFAALWSDPGLVRHGRSGQRQSGVDIISRPGGRWSGLQCKRKEVWPVKSLTTADIDKEVKEALTFTPALGDFWILTTAPDDTHLQEHVRQLTKRHENAKLFKVHLLGWREIVRRATLYPRVVAKHFGIQAAERAPLLVVWSAVSAGLNVSKQELAIRCRELVHELNNHPHGRILVRQQESDNLAGQLITYVGATLTFAEREQRLRLLDELAKKERQEARIAQGLRLLFTDPSIAYIFQFLEGPGMAQTVRNYVHMELGPIGVQVTRDLVYMRMEPRNHGKRFRAQQPVTKGQQRRYFDRDQELRKKFGEKVRCDSVTELPDDIKSEIALPAITRTIVNELVEHSIDGWSIEELRAHKILDINDWSVQLV